MLILRNARDRETEIARGGEYFVFNPLVSPGKLFFEAS
jgi:hypothetical protein